MSPENHDTQGLDNDTARHTALSARPQFRSACLPVGAYVETCANSPPAEIEQNDWNLSFNLYMDTSEEEERIDMAEAVRKLRGPEQARVPAEASMNRYLTELRYGQ